MGAPSGFDGPSATVVSDSILPEPLSEPVYERASSAAGMVSRLRSMRRASCLSPVLNRDRPGLLRGDLRSAQRRSRDQGFTI